MNTIAFSRHNALLVIEDAASYDIPDEMSCQAHYTVVRARGETKVRIVRVEREIGKDDVTGKPVWELDDLPTGEKQALRNHIKWQFERDDAEDARNVREVAEGYS